MATKAKDKKARMLCADKAQGRGETYEVNISYLGKGGKKRHKEKFLVTDCAFQADAVEAVKLEMAAREFSEDQVVFEDIIERKDIAPRVVDVPEGGEPAENASELFPEPEPEDEVDHASIRCVKFYAKISDMAIKNGEHRSLTLKLLIGGSACSQVSREILDTFRNDDILAITVEPSQLTEEDVNPPHTKKFLPTNMAPGKDAEIKGADPAVLGDNTTTYCCPYCQMPIDASTKAHPDKLQCPSCEKWFPISDGLDHATDPENAGEGLFADGKSETQEERNARIAAGDMVDAAIETEA